MVAGFYGYASPFTAAPLTLAQQYAAQWASRPGAPDSAGDPPLNCGGQRTSGALLG
jgi:hypothetical protein